MSYRDNTCLRTTGRPAGRSAGRTDGRTGSNQYTPPSPSVAGGIKMILWKNKSISGWRICDLADIWPLGADIWPLGKKNQNSAALRFCIWPFYTFLCDISTIQWKLLDEFAKVWKKHQKRQVFPSLWPWPWPGDLETYARIFMYPRSIYPASFVKFG